MHSIESRFVIGPSNIPFAGAYVSTFQPRNFTGWDSEGVNVKTVMMKHAWCDVVSVVVVLIFYGLGRG